MNDYEIWSLVLTTIYNLLTFGLLSVVAYEAFIKPKRENIAIYFHAKPKDTKNWSWERQNMDFVIDNRGPEIKNIKISSDPDFLGWGYLGKDIQCTPRKTSEYFHSKISLLSSGQKYSFFWSDIEANKEVLQKPFTIMIEYENPAFFFPKTRKKVVPFDFSTFDGTYFGVNEKYDNHNIAQELTRIREILGKQNKNNT